MEYQKSNRFYVYALVDPINRIPFYIGKGTGKRAFQHLKNDSINKEKLNYIKNLRNLGFEPEVHFLMENLDEKVSYEMEYILIKKAYLWGIKLTNKIGLIIPPSRKGSKMSDESKEKIKNFQKGRKKPPMSVVTKEKLSKINLGKKGPNKVENVNISTLKLLYQEKNYTKKQIMNEMNIGLGSLNRILKENRILKSTKNFKEYGEKSQFINTNIPY